MSQNRGSIAPGSAQIPGLSLISVWTVDEGPDYDVIPRMKLRDTFIAVRTFAGEGLLDLGDGTVLNVGGDTLIFVARDRLQRYRTAVDSWRFWWFEFRLFGPTPFTVDRIFPTNGRREDKPRFNRIFRRLRQPDPLSRSRASAEFSTLLYDWLQSCCDEQQPSPYEAEIHQTIDLMHDNLDGNLTVPELAQAVNMAERNYRGIFTRLMGSSPKSYYLAIRLEMALHLMQTHGLTVSEVAERLGFSSPFHLSKAFRQRFGYPPSSVRGDR